jgi:hypothetical protein
MTYHPGDLVQTTDNIFCFPNVRPKGAARDVRITIWKPYKERAFHGPRFLYARAKEKGTVEKVWAGKRSQGRKPRIYATVIMENGKYKIFNVQYLTRLC